MYLWRECGEEGMGMMGLRAKLERIDGQSRRQWYANLVESAIEFAVYEGDREAEEGLDRFFSDLTFPHLKKLNILLDCEHRLPRLTTGTGPHDGIEELAFQCRYEVCYPEQFMVQQDDMDDVLAQVVECYPRVKKVEFWGAAVAYPGTAERFRKKMMWLSEGEEGLYWRNVYESDDPEL